jgi:hypothetical protein
MIYSWGSYHNIAMSSRHGAHETWNDAEDVVRVLPALLTKKVIVYRVSPDRQSKQTVTRWWIKPVERLAATERRKRFLSSGSINQTSVSETKSILDAIVSTVDGTESILVVMKTVLETAESILDVTTTILNEAETMLDDTSSIVSGSKRIVFVARGSLSAGETVRFGTLTTLFVPTTRVFVASTTGFVTLSIVVVMLSIVGNAMQVQSFQWLQTRSILSMLIVALSIVVLILRMLIVRTSMLLAMESIPMTSSRILLATRQCSPKR